MNLCRLRVLQFVAMPIARVLRELWVASPEVDTWGTIAQFYHVFEALPSYNKMHVRYSVRVESRMGGLKRKF